MKLEDQCVNLELSKKLKSLNVKQESIFYWIYLEDPFLFHPTNFGISKQKIDEYICSSFTASELLEMLPSNVNGMTLRVIKNWDNSYSVAYPDLTYQNRTTYFDDKNLCNILAKMLIALIEQKIIEV